MDYCEVFVVILPWQTQLLSVKPILNVIHGANTQLSQTFLQRNISLIKNKTYIACILNISGMSVVLLCIFVKQNKLTITSTKDIALKAMKALTQLNSIIETTKNVLKTPVIHERAWTWIRPCWSRHDTPWVVLVPVFVPKPSFQIFLVVLRGTWRTVSTLPTLLKTGAVQTQSNPLITTYNTKLHLNHIVMWLAGNISIVFVVSCSLSSDIIF